MLCKLKWVFMRILYFFGALRISEGIMCKFKRVFISILICFDQEYGTVYCKNLNGFFSIKNIGVCIMEMFY